MLWHNNIPLIAILRGITPQEIDAHIEELITAGFTAIEIPTNSPDWQQSIQLAVQHFGQQALVGGGTVVKTEQVETIADVGGQLIVTPNTDIAVIRAAAKHQLVIAAGCATPSEAFHAIDAGAQSLKVFPSSAFGPAYIKAIKTVLPSAVPIFAVGGVTSENLKDFIAAGCIGAGLGSDLYRAGQPVSRTRQKAQEFMNAFKEAVK